jgi:prepilin-type processing-associated H-X9-DG protein
MPAMTAAKRQAKSVQCKSNLRTNYQFLQMYANDNKGIWCPDKLGHTDVPSGQEWPSVVFHPKKPAGQQPTMICPSDEPQPPTPHSYVVNAHVLRKNIKQGKTGGKGLSASDIILMGEKKTESPDFYMEYRQDGSTEFWGLVEKYRHGIQLGSNYVMMDGHVDSKMPREAEMAMDPWDIPIAGQQPPPPPQG